MKRVIVVGLPCSGKTYLSHQILKKEVQLPVDEFRKVTWRFVEGQMEEQAEPAHYIIQLAIGKWPGAFNSNLNKYLINESICIFVLIQQEQLLNQWGIRMNGVTSLPLKTKIIRFNRIRKKLKTMGDWKKLYDNRNELRELYLNNFRAITQFNHKFTYVFLPDKQEFIKIPEENNRVMKIIKAYYV